MAAFVLNAQPLEGREMCYPAFEACDADPLGRMASVYIDVGSFLAEFGEGYGGVGQERSATLVGALSAANRFMTTGKTRGEMAPGSVWTINLPDGATVRHDDEGVEAQLVQILKITPVTECKEEDWDDEGPE